MKSLLVTLLMGVAFWLGLASAVPQVRIVKVYSDGPRPELQTANYCSAFYRSLPCQEQDRICRARERAGKVAQR